MKVKIFRPFPEDIVDEQCWDLRIGYWKTIPYNSCQIRDRVMDDKPLRAVKPPPSYINSVLYFK